AAQSCRIDHRVTSLDAYRHFQTAPQSFTDIGHDAEILAVGPGVRAHRGLTARRVNVGAAQLDHLVDTPLHAQQTLAGNSTGTTVPRQNRQAVADVIAQEYRDRSVQRGNHRATVSAVRHE